MKKHTTILSKAIKKLLQRLHFKKNAKGRFIRYCFNVYGGIKQHPNALSAP